MDDGDIMDGDLDGAEAFDAFGVRGGDTFPVLLFGDGGMGIEEEGEVGIIVGAKGFLPNCTYYGMRVGGEN